MATDRNLRGTTASSGRLTIHANIQPIQPTTVGLSSESGYQLRSSACSQATAASSVVTRPRWIAMATDQFRIRSEERRVGKEGRSEWTAENVRRKMNAVQTHNA